MQNLIDMLGAGQCSLVILHDGRVRSFGGHGVSRLYNIMAEEPELLYDAKLAAKAVGGSAAQMMVEGGVAEVWADYISQQACDLLLEAGVKVGFGRRMSHAAFLRLWQRLGETAAVTA